MKDMKWDRRLIKIGWVTEAMKRIVCNSVIFFMFLGCVCSAWGWPWSKNAAAADDAVANLGSVAVETAVRHTFTFENKGSKPIKIVKVETSCECLSIVSRPETISPRSKGQIEVELTPRKPGRFRYGVTAEFEGIPQSNRLFQLDVTVVGSVTSTVVAPSRAVVNRDEQLYLSVDRLARDLKAGDDVTLVDVRDGDAYTAAHMPGALNMPLYVVKTKGFLRAKPMVLVDAGWGSEVVENECRRLRMAGFSELGILQGGLNAWRSNGGALEGTGAGALAVAELDPQSYLSARRFDDWLVVNASGSASSTVSSISEEVRVPYSREEAQRFVRDIQALVAQRDHFTRLLVVSEDGGDYDQIQQALGKLDGCSVFYLAGGEKALEEQLKMMAAMKNSREKTTGTFTMTGAGGAIRKPCGSCP